MLAEHLRSWVGAWPPPVQGRLCVIAVGERLAPGWDGAVRRVLGVVQADGSGVVGVQPGMPEGQAGSLDEAAALIGVRLWDAAFRWCDADSAPSADVLAELGEWVSPHDERLPEWLRPFNGGVLVATDDEGRYQAGVGIKRHDAFGQEISVGTDPAAQGRGLARRLVATAARHIVAQGAVPTYLHDFRNTASAKVADAAGFPDRGWRVIGASGTS